MTRDQGKNNESGSRDTGKEISVYKKDSGDREDRGPLRRFYDKYMTPQGEDGHYSIVHDVLVAIIVVLIIITAIYGYTRTWPPVVVVESGSMQHSTESSALGVIDTGDIVMVKKVTSEDDITPWSIGKEKDYKTYGEYGDVIIYDKNGQGGTPVIHRAIVYIRVNETNKQAGDPYTFDVPEWGIYNNQTIEYYIEELNLQINYTPPRGHNGYLTKGDNQMTNTKIDQQSGISDVHGRIVEQVSIDWVVGVARGEVPWFGLIKLNINGNDGYDEAPDNSKTDLKISLVLLLGVPIALNIMYYAFASKYGTLEQGDEKKGSSGGDANKGSSGRDANKGSSGRDANKGSSGADAKGSGGGRDKHLSKRSEKVKIGKKGGY